MFFMLRQYVLVTVPLSEGLCVLIVNKLCKQFVKSLCSTETPTTWLASFFTQVVFLFIGYVILVGRYLT